MYKDYPAAIERMHRETAILLSLHNPYVVGLHDFHFAGDKLQLVMDFVEGGNLEEEVCGRGVLAEHEARFIFLQLLLGVRYIHGKGIVHRDLKPENVLVDQKGSWPSGQQETAARLLRVRISDFGASKLVRDGCSIVHTVAGTPIYRAPEVSESSSLGYDQRADLWSLGCLLHYLLEKALPFDFASSKKWEVRFRQGCRLSFDVRDLIQSLVQQKPQERLPLDGCLKHPWLVLPTGPVSRFLKTGDDRAGTEREVRVPLPNSSCLDFKKLRSDLQKFSLRHMCSAELSISEVRFSAWFGREDELAAWEDLMMTLQSHFTPGTFTRFELDRAEPLTCEPQPSVRELLRHDRELVQVRQSFAKIIVAAADGDCAPVPRRVDLRVIAGSRILELVVELATGYPEGAGINLLTLRLRFAREVAPTILEEKMRRDVNKHLQELPRAEGSLQMFLRWLDEEVPRLLETLSFPSPSKTRIGKRSR